MQAILGFILNIALDWLLKVLKREIAKVQEKAEKDALDEQRAKDLLEKLEKAKTKEERLNAARDLLRGT